MITVTCDICGKVHENQQPMYQGTGKFRFAGPITVPARKSSGPGATKTSPPGVRLVVNLDFELESTECRRPDICQECVLSYIRGAVATPPKM